MPDDRAEPTPKPPLSDWEHYILYTKVIEAINEIHPYFKSTISISGINATEIYAFGAVLGLTIEQEVIRTLNNLHIQWDSDSRYADYRFVRQAQTFPDVLLRDPKSGHIIMGVELKSWYLLAKESEPSFRYQVSPGVCNSQDLLVVVPWVLSTVFSGSPTIFTPFIASARYVAEYRNYWWQHKRKAKGDNGIVSPSVVRPYPGARDQISDMPVSDQGNNFGRIARIGIMDDYVVGFKQLALLGVEVDQWRRFLEKQITEEMGIPPSTDTPTD